MPRVLSVFVYSTIHKRHYSAVIGYDGCGVWSSIFSEDYCDEATAYFVVAGLPILNQSVKHGPPAADFTITPDDDEEPLGYWYVDKGDKRVKDFPQE